MRALRQIVLLLLVGCWPAGFVRADDPPGTVEQAPRVAITAITLSSGDITHRFDGASLPRGTLHFAATGDSAAVALTATLTVQEVEDLRLSAQLGPERIPLEPTAKDEAGWHYQATWRIATGDPQQLRLFAEYRPKVLPLPGASMSTDDGKLDLTLSAKIAADEALRAGEGCRGAAHSYFGGNRILGVLVDMAQFGAVVVVDVTLDVLSIYLGGKWAKDAAEGAAITARYVMVEIGKRFVVNAANSLTQSVVNSFIQGTPWLKHWKQNSFNAFVSGVFGGLFGQKLTQANLAWLRWLGEGDEVAMKAIAAFIAEEANQRPGSALSASLLGSLWEKLGESYRAEADRFGLTPRFFVMLADDKSIFDHRIQVAGLQWLVTGEGALLVSCTPPGAQSPAANWLVRFRSTGSGVSNVQVLPQPVGDGRTLPVDEGASQAELEKLGRDLDLAGLSEAAAGSAAGPANEEGWRPAVASGSIRFELRNYLDAAEVPAGAPWRVTRTAIDLVAASGEVAVTPASEDEVLAGQGLAATWKVEAGVGGAWLPVAGAAVVLDWNGAGAPGNLSSDQQGLVTARLTAPGAPAYLRLEAKVAAAGSGVFALQAYDYALEGLATTPASGQAAADGEDAITFAGRLVRRFVDSGGRGYSETLIEPARDFTAVRFAASDHRLMLALNGEAPDDPSDAADLTPAEDGRFSLKVTSEVAGSFTIRVLPFGGRYSSRDAEFGSLAAAFTGGPADFRLVFGAPHSAQIDTDGVLALENLTLRSPDEQVLTILARSTRQESFDEPVAGVRVKLTADKPDALQIRYGEVVTGEDGVAVGGGDGRSKPSLWGLQQEGPILVTVSAEGAQAPLTIRLTGVETREDFALAATADPDQVDMEADPWTEVSGSLMIPAGEDMGSILDSRYKLWVSASNATLEVDPAYLLGEIGWGGLHDTARVATLKPSPQAAAATGPQRATFKFRIGLHETRDPEVKVFILDTKEQETVAELQVAIAKRRERIALSDPGQAIESCAAIGLDVQVPGDFPAGGWVALVPAGAPDLQAPDALEPEQRVLGPLGETAELYAPEESGDYELRLYRDGAGTVAHRLPISVAAADLPEDWADSDEPGVDLCNPPLLGIWRREVMPTVGIVRISLPLWAEITLAERPGFTYRIEAKPVILNQHGVAGVISYCNREGRWLTCVTRYEELTGCPPVDYVPGRYRIAPDGQSLIQDFEVHYSIDYETCSLVDITDLFARSGQPVPGARVLLEATDAVALDCTPPMDPLAGEQFDPERESFEAFLNRNYAKLHCTPIAGE